MKLFQRLLIAPAALGLLAPLAANADGFESAKTKVNFSSAFTTGFIDTAATDNNKLTSEYNYKTEVTSSFQDAGTDRLYIEIEAGNQDDLVLESSVVGGNGLSVASAYYQFPVGQFTVTAGPLFDQDDVISANISAYNSNFRLEEMPWATAGDTGAGVGVSYIAENGFNGSFNLLGQNANNSTLGAFTEEGTDMYTASVGYDSDTGNYGGGIVYTAEDQTADDTKDTSIGAGVYFRPDGFPTITVGFDKLKDDNGTDSNDFFIGLGHPIGSGTLHAAWQAQDTAGTDTTNYEVYYTYEINDGVEVAGGIFSEEVDGVDNTQGFIVETNFKF